MKMNNLRSEKAVIKTEMPWKCETSAKAQVNFGLQLENTKEKKGRKEENNEECSGSKSKVVA
jgi:hypothetical protein